MKLTFSLACLFGSVSAFSTTSLRARGTPSTCRYADTQQDAFAAFADSLEQDEIVVEEEEDESWQERLETLLDPLTPLAQRQVLMSELLQSNEDIRNSVTAALRDRRVRK